MTDIGRFAAGHAFIIASPDAQLRDDTAKRLAAAMVCRGDNKPCLRCAECRRVLDGVHPDVITITRLKDDSGKQKKEIQVDQIRGMSADAWVRPSQADRKVYLLPEAGKMNVAAQNAALKTLEEPPLYAAFILCCENERELLPTVRSRCVTISPGGEEKTRENPVAEQYIQLASRGDPMALCEFFADCESMNTEQFGRFAEDVRQALSEILCRRRGGMDEEKAWELLSVFEKVGSYMNVNVSVKHICGMLCALTN